MAAFPTVVSDSVLKADRSRQADAVLKNLGDPEQAARTATADKFLSMLPPLPEALPPRAANKEQGSGDVANVAPPPAPNVAPSVTTDTPAPTVAPLIPTTVQSSSSTASPPSTTMGVDQGAGGGDTGSASGPSDPGLYIEVARTPAPLDITGASDVAASAATSASDGGSRKPDTLTVQPSPAAPLPQESADRVTAADQFLSSLPPLPDYSNTTTIPTPPPYTAAPTSSPTAGAPSRGASLAAAPSVYSPPSGSPSSSSSSGSGPSSVDASSHQSFVSSLQPLAEDWAQRTGIPAAAWLAMGASESNWGKAGNALFGIKGSGTAGSLNSPTWESVNGQRVATSDNFADYTSPNDAFQGFWDLMQTPHYAPATAYLTKTDDWRGFLQQINAAGYATDPTWGRGIANIADSTIAPMLGPSSSSGNVMGAMRAAPDDQASADRSSSAAPDVSAPSVAPQNATQANGSDATGPTDLIAALQNVRTSVPASTPSYNDMAGASSAPQGFSVPDLGDRGLSPDTAATAPSDVSALTPSSTFRVPTPQAAFPSGIATPSDVSTSYNDMAGANSATPGAPIFGQGSTVPNQYIPGLGRVDPTTLNPGASVGAAMAMLNLPGEAISTLANVLGDDTAAPVGESALARLARYWQQTDPSQSFGERAREFVDYGSRVNDPAFARIAQADPSGGTLTGLLHLFYTQGTNPLTYVGAGDILPAMATGAALAGGVGGELARRSGATPQEVAGTAEQAGGLGMMGGPIAESVGRAAVSAAPAVGRGIAKVAPIVGQGIKDFGEAANEAGLVPGLSIRPVGDANAPSIVDLLQKGDPVTGVTAVDQSLRNTLTEMEARIAQRQSTTNQGINALPSDPAREDELWRTLAQDRLFGGNVITSERMPDFLAELQQLHDANSGFGGYRYPLSLPKDLTANPTLGDFATGRAPRPSWMRSAPSTGGAAVGGYLGSQQPADTEQQRIQNIAGGAALGAIGGHLAPRGNVAGESNLGLSLRNPTEAEKVALGALRATPPAEKLADAQSLWNATKGVAAQLGQGLAVKGLDPSTFAHDLSFNDQVIQDAVKALPDAPGTAGHAEQAAAIYRDESQYALQRLGEDVTNRVQQLKALRDATTQGLDPQLVKLAGLVDPKTTDWRPITTAAYKNLTGVDLHDNAVLLGKGGVRYANPDYAYDDLAHEAGVGDMEALRTALVSTARQQQRLADVKQQISAVGQLAGPLNRLTKENASAVAAHAPSPGASLLGAPNQGPSDLGTPQPPPQGSADQIGLQHRLVPDPTLPKTPLRGGIGGTQEPLPGPGTPRPPAPSVLDNPRTPIWMRPAPPVEDVPSVPKDTFPQRPSTGVTEGKFGEPKSPLAPRDALAPVERALTNPVPTFAQGLQSKADELLRQTYDRLYPLRELDRAAGLGPNVGSHATAQVVSGAIAAGEDNVRRFVVPIFDDLGKEADTLERYWVLQSAKDVLAKYPQARLPGGIDGWQGVLKGEAALKAQVGPERFAQVEEAAKKLWALNDELRLKPLEEAGIISPEQRAAYRNTNPHYLPFDRHAYSVDDPSALLPRPTSQLSVSSSGIGKRTAGGSELSLDEPMARWVADLVQTQVIVSRNRAARSIVEALQSAEKATGAKLVVVAPQTTAESAGLGKATLDRGAISFFDTKQPGVKQVANVPKIYEVVAKGLEAEPANALGSVMSALAAPMRVGNTALSVAFLPVNVIRDFQNAFYREGVSPLSPEYWRGLKAAIARNTDFSEVAQSGALMSGLLESSKSRDVLRIARDATQGGIQVHSPMDALLVLPKMAAAVPKAIYRVNEIAEQAPRIGTYFKLTDAGASQLEAAVRARDVTADFAKSGNFVRTLNQMVPFLNARIQGGVNVGRTLVEDPKRALTMAAPFVTASLVSWAWNNRFASSAQIPTYEYDRNWVFQIGEGTRDKDPKNPNAPAQTFPIYLKIPKGDAAAVATAPVDALLRIALQKDDRSATEILLHALQASVQGLAPIDPSGNAIISTLTPPVLQTGLSLSSNYDYFRQRTIVPQGEMQRPPEQQFDATVSKTAVELGQRFGVSPRLIDFALRNYTGGAGQQTEWLADLALGALGYNPPIPGAATAQPLTPVEQAAQLPVVSRFVGTRNTGQESQQYQTLQQAVTDSQRLLYTNPEFARFGLGVQPVSQTVTVGGVKVPLTTDDQILLQQTEAQEAKKELDALVQRQAYRGAKDAIRRQQISNVLGIAHQRAENTLIRSLGPAEIRQRLHPSTVQAS